MAEEQKPADPPVDEPHRRRGRRRILMRVGAVLVAVAAGLVVSLLTIDLGPDLRARAEREGSKYIQRPMRIGRLSAHLIPGVFVVEDLVIEGLSPKDRPFLTAKTITVRLPWWTAFTRRLTIESIDMTDWQMLVETFPGGHNFPKFTRDRRTGGPSRFTTTLKGVTATRGQFTYEDHTTPWSTVARNLNVSLYRSFATNDYRGRASFSNGTIAIQSYEPFRADMQSRFKLDGSKVRFDRIDLISDGARSVLDGVVDLGRWPEQTYNVRSQIDFATQKNIFFHRDKFDASGRGEFRGTFRMFRGGRELKGSFTSPMAGVNAWRFPNLKGSVLWVRDRLEVTDTTSELYGGTARFDYRMAPFGRGVPTVASWDVTYTNVDLARLTDFLETEGLRLAGRASGRNSLRWPVGEWENKRGEGESTVRAPEGVAVMTRELPVAAAAAEAALPPEAGPFNPRAPIGYVPVAGHITYRLDPEWIQLDQSWAATSKTYVDFNGRTAFGERSRIPFHVTSVDWQESDRLLAAIMTAFGSPTGAIAIGGYGEFDGVMLNAFTRPRIEGTFTGDWMRAWDVVWGSGRAEVVIENSYAFVKNAVVKSGESEIVADGQFSLGYPRRDRGEEINARVRINRRPLADLRHAFELDDYPVEGLVSGEYHVYGNYETPLGFGRLLIEKGVAYGETFDSAQSSLRFEGTGVRLDGLQIAKSTGSATGAAWVGWDGNYSFDLDGRRIPVESLVTAKVPRAPLSGLLQFNATGAGSFESPRYDVKLRVDDLFAGDEGIGQLTARLALRGELLTADMEAASPRLSVSGSGRLALTPEMDAEMSLRFSDTSLDPYLRFIEPRLSPFTTAVADGTVRVVGELADIDHLVVDTRVERLDLKLFDYRLKNDGPIQLVLDQHVLDVSRLRLVGEGTQLEVGGDVALHEGNISLQATGDANLGILQGFFRNLRSRGRAALSAKITGPLSQPVFSGSARIADGRVRHLSLPHALDAINGTISFDAGGLRIDDLAARMGEGQVRFGGRVAMNGFTPGELNLTATGEQMQVRYPEGFRSIIDADLWLRGSLGSPIVGGMVTVKDAVWTRRFDLDPNLFEFGGSTTLATGPAAPALPLRFDIQVNAPSSLRIENNIAHIVSSGELKLQGTYDRPLLFGHAEIERGDLVLEGNRYLVTRGTIDFLNPAGRIEPLFDIEAETRVRVPSQNYSQAYRVTVGVSGTRNQITLTLASDPPLPEFDIVSLLFGQNTSVEDAELRALRPEAAADAKEALIRALGVRVAASPISAPVSRVVEETFRLDTAQVTPTVGSETDPLSLSSARLVLGKRLSPRAFLTFSRALGTADRNQIIVLEYDHSDRLGFVVTQIGESTFAVDLRVRRSF